MITLAIISDIHGNLPALEAVLKDIGNRPVDGIYCLGDLTDFAPWGNEVIEKIRNLSIPTLMGNHDQRIAFDEEILPLSHQGPLESSNRVKAITISKSSIRPDNKHWLSSLPYTLEISYKTERDIKKIMLVHASPDSNDRYLFQEDSKTQMAQELAGRGVNALVMGHTHLSYIQHAENVLFVNAGSVGRSKEADRLASYCLLTLSQEQLSAEIVKINYDIRRVIKAIQQSEIPDFYADFFITKR